MLRDSDLPGQVDVAVRGLTAVLVSAAAQPHSGGAGGGGGARGPADGEAPDVAEGGGPSSRRLDALKRGVVATLGQLLETASRETAKAAGADDVMTSARRAAVLAAVLAVGGTCSAAPADGREEASAPDEPPTNGNGVHAANGDLHAGDSGRQRCLQASHPLRCYVAVFCPACKAEEPFHMTKSLSMMVPVVLGLELKLWFCHRL